MWKNKKVSVVFPCYNEEKNIRNAINDFFSNGYVDEIVVVDNNSKDRSAQEIKKTKAKYFLEKRQGYGNALMRGMREANGDLIITSEPDASFCGKDVLKLLIYSDDFDVVFGTRTAKSMISKGAKMNWFTRCGNIAVAKYLSFMHNGPCLTDVGCTMRLIKRNVYERIKGKLTVGGSHFSPEMMICCIRTGFRCIEIPLHYGHRIGDSKITSSFWKTFKLGMRMIFLITAYRFKTDWD